MKLFIQTIVLLLLMSSLVSCSVKPFKKDFKLPPQEINREGIKTGDIRLVLYNNANFLLYGIDNSSDINIKINNRGLGRLDRKKYIVVDVKGEDHEFYLEHRDAFIFDSTHKLKFKEKLNFVEIKPTAVSNQIKIKKKLPNDFEKEFINGLASQ